MSRCYNPDTINKKEYFLTIRIPQVIYIECPSPYTKIRNKDLNEENIVNVLCENNGECKHIHIVLKRYLIRKLKPQSHNKILINSTVWENFLTP